MVMQRRNQTTQDNLHHPMTKRSKIESEVQPFKKQPRLMRSWHLSHPGPSPSSYLLHKELSEDQTNACRIIRQSKACKFREGDLYKQSATGVLQWCISEEEGTLFPNEVHSSMSRHHAAAGTLVSKAFQAGFYWPTVGAYAKTLVQHCPGYQVFAKHGHIPPTALGTIPIEGVLD